MSECKPHKAFFGEDDCCPICEGIQAERERIIALLEPIATQCTLCHYDAEMLIALIKGDIDYENVVKGENE